MARVNRYIVWIVTVACLGAYTYGFAYAVFATSIGQPGFYLYFGLDRESFPPDATLALRQYPNCC